MKQKLQLKNCNNNHVPNQHLATFWYASHFFSRKEIKNEKNANKKRIEINLSRTFVREYIIYTRRMKEEF